MAILLPLIVGYAIGKAAVYAYKNLLIPEQKRKIENKAKTHHFEYGLVTTAAGLVINSPTTVGTGISWISDDWKDKDAAIENLKNKIGSVINQARQGFQTQNVSYSSPFIHNPRMRQMYRRINY